MFGVPGNYVGPIQKGHTVKPTEPSDAPSEATMAALALHRLEDAAKEHAIAVENAKACVLRDVPGHLVNMILVKGTALDHAIVNAARYHDNETIARVAYLHPMYVDDVLAGMF